MLVRPHDLVLLADPGAVLSGDEPGWVRRALAAAPWVVIRRAAVPAGWLAVGVRGSARHERHALQIGMDAVARLIRPEQLRTGRGRQRTPALAALQSGQAILDGVADVWGPTGSTGFELATGRPTTTDRSDLDLVLRLAALPSSDWAAELLDQLSGLPAAVDCQVQTPAGAVALAELATGIDSIVLRTQDGPRLVTHAGPR